MPPSSSPKDRSSWGASYTRAMSLATILPACVFVGYAIGWGLDKWLGTGFLKVVFLLLGVIAGFVSLIRDISKGSNS
jgi:ATP synthase protein I